MAPRSIRTIDTARRLGVHPNMVRKYEAQGYLPDIPRSPHGYRLYTRMHVEQAHLAHLALRWPYVSDKAPLHTLVTSAVGGDYGMATELAYQYLAQVRVERTCAESALDFLERWAAGFLPETPQARVNTSTAAQYLNLSVDMLRNWERNGLIDVPRDPSNQYRLYGTTEFGRLRVIRILLQSGYSLMSIRRMFQHVDAGNTGGLRTALDMTGDDDLRTVVDHWLASLMELEHRAQEIIQQIGRMIDLAHPRTRR
ncbi:MAG: Transcriptional regulator, MerR family [uncultured Chloroflexia bacterium]|uniref:Transcriptional regulator, MerR family n=1 Tax=uncultured Chloroflexia bacterium TaxID=1672391 RepID=A0A6J4JYT9_9CHLR|nr:MAG: Transcriptional regulator, MerR family [uncultured Chloroflexia bacterium]